MSTWLSLLYVIAFVMAAAYVGVALIILFDAVVLSRIKFDKRNLNPFLWGYRLMEWWERQCNKLRP